MTSDWKIQTDAGDFFGQQRRRADIEARRPLIRRASDLVGPGIGQHAVSITDYNNLLATYNGYFSSDIGATNAPNGTDPFVGIVISDSLLGGRQVFTSLTTGEEYTRTFTRNPFDAESITFDSAWRPRGRIPATATAVSATPTSVDSGDTTFLNFPTLTLRGEPDTYEEAGSRVNILRQGVYTGYLRVVAASPGGMSFSATNLRHPHEDTFTSMVDGSESGSGFYRAFTFATTVGTQSIRMSVTHITGVSKTVSITSFHITRVGDAV